MRPHAVLGCLALIFAAACGGSTPTASGAPPRPSVAPSLSASSAACSSPAVTQAGSEPHLVRASMAFDKATHQVVLFGVPSGGPTAQTWAWTAQDGWVQLAPAHAPPGRTWGDMAYDDATATIALFGGQSATAVNGALDPLGDTWTWNGVDWIQQRPPASPPATVSMSMTYDPSTNTVLGVRDDDFVARTDTWQWTGGTWTQLQAGQPPRYPKQGAGIAYAQGVGVDLMFGTVFFTTGAPAPDGRTWTRASNTWTAPAPAAADPPARSFPGVAANPDGGILMFGGGGSGYAEFGDTWTWYGRWDRLAVTPAPPARSRPLMAYDSACQVVVLYGGEVQTASSLTPDYDTWVWSGEAWARVG